MDLYSENDIISFLKPFVTKSIEILKKRKKKHFFARLFNSIHECKLSFRTIRILRFKFVINYCSVPHTVFEIGTLTIDFTTWKRCNKTHVIT